MGTGRIADELRRPVRSVPPMPLHRPVLLRLLQRLSRGGRPAPIADVRSTVHPGPPPVRVSVPERRTSDGALLWIHGGGLVLGSALMDDKRCGTIAAELGIVVVSVDYRLAPAHPFPGALNDCHAAWIRLCDDADRLGIDPRRIAVGGASAGAGLAAALAQRLHDERTSTPAAEQPIAQQPVAQQPVAQWPVAQWLLYPMLDDRTAARRELDRPRHHVWHNRNNEVGWRSYLGHAPGTATPPPYAVPARRDDLTGLPPAWIGVGDTDLFHDEDVTYAERLRTAGVAVTLDVVPGAPHGFDGWGSGTRIADDFTARATTWLRDAVG